MPNNDRRLIEDLIPIREISAEASREKSLRHGNISTLHIWWSRKPITASRAAVYGALVPAPTGSKERAVYMERMRKLCSWDAPTSVLEQARKDILAASGGQPPLVLDMFAGGGSTRSKPYAWAANPTPSNSTPSRTLLNSAPWFTRKNMALPSRQA
jgi:putative DNA methylase